MAALGVQSQNQYAGCCYKFETAVLKKKDGSFGDMMSVVETTG